ncbi:hypothetical protein GCM10011414_29770 [Croceivirga lutea]|uniref:hypothetical protein n=1 Tax=Croceivirga lutea TaxID=1775167 RepID=UPI001639F46F|nr:hypothetical protein [Croceivirga lutea]GGG58017.1 hypothetical protein GCM10011414_29770 [Croceivirga lutea]
MNLSVLESKLHRHKISFSKENEGIIIGKAKNDPISYIGLVIMPIVFGIGIIIFLFFGVNGFRIEMAHISAAALFLIGLGSFNQWKRKRKKLANSFLKVFKDNKIIIQTPEQDFQLDKNSILDIRISNKPLDKENYEGNLFIIDNENRIHHILGFHDENEKYVEDDLKWFVDFILSQTGLKK